jgi:hypothetical protein
MKIVSNKPQITRKELEGSLNCLINEELTTGSAVKTFESELSNLVGQNIASPQTLLLQHHILFSRPWSSILTM